MQQADIMVVFLQGFEVGKVSRVDVIGKTLIVLDPTLQATGARFEVWSILPEKLEVRAAVEKYWISLNVACKVEFQGCDA